MYFDKFSQEAAELFLISQKEAETFGHRLIDAEHILLAVAKISSSTVYDILVNQYDIDYEDIKNEILKSLGQGFTRSTSMSPQISPRLKSILEMAFEESKVFETQKIETEHVFLAILRHNQNGAVRILSRLNVNVTTLNRDLLTRMNPKKDVGFGEDKKINNYLIKQLKRNGIIR